VQRTRWKVVTDMGLVAGAPKPRRLLLWTLVAMCLVSAVVAPLVFTANIDGRGPLSGAKRKFIKLYRYATWKDRGIRRLTKAGEPAKPQKPAHGVTRY
jgi:hypothetical protein